MFLRILSTCSLYSSVPAADNTALYNSQLNIINNTIKIHRPIYCCANDDERKKQLEESAHAVSIETGYTIST